MATTSAWTILSSRAAMPSGRCLPSALGMYLRRDGNARYAPEWTLFAGTIDECDFFVPCIIGYGLRPSRRGPGHDYRGQDEDLPVPAQKMCAHAGGLMTTRG